MRLFLAICAIFALVQLGESQISVCDELKAPSTILRPLFTIGSACYVIVPNDKMAMRVWGVRGRGPHTGLYLHVRDGENKISGSWELTTNLFRTVSCGSQKNAAITHTSDVPKDDNTFHFDWTAPSECKQNEEFEIKAIIRRSSTESQTVTVPLVCNADYSNVAVLERVRPPLKSQYCARVSWAILPKGSTTSFEEPITSEGWTHLFSDPKLQFTRNTGSTATANTGPMKAIHGQYYLYYEASGTRQHDMAGLISPFGIQGCFCLTFSCHMNTDGRTKFTLSTIGDIRRVILSTRKVNTAWETLSYTFLTNRPVVLAFQAFSSGSEKGDVGLDDIRITPGRCKTASTAVDLTDPTFP